MERLLPFFQLLEKNDYFKGYIPELKTILDKGVLPKKNIRVHIPVLVSEKLVDLLSSPEQMNVLDERILSLLCYSGHADILGDKLKKIFARERSGEDLFTDFAMKYPKIPMPEGYSSLDPLWLIMCHDITTTYANGELNSVGRFVLAQSDDELNERMKHVFPVKLIQFLLKHAPDRISAVLASAMASHRGEEVGKFLLDVDSKKYAPLLHAALKKLPGLRDRYAYGVVFAKTCPDLFRNDTEQNAIELLKDSSRFYFDLPPACWLITEIGMKHFDLIRNDNQKTDLGYHDIQVLETAVQVLGQKARPLVLDALSQRTNRYLQIVKLLIDVQLPEDEKLILSEFKTRLEPHKDLEALRETMRLLKTWKPELLVPELQRILVHKSKPTRELSAQILGTIGEAMIEPARKLLKEKKTEARMNGVIILAGIKTDKAVELLENHLDTETDDDVRDRILAALESVWTAQGKTITMDDIRKRIERSRPAWSVAKWDWIDPKTLPRLHVREKPLDLDAVRYLLYRQSRAKGVAVDLEAKSLIKMLDRETSGDFALAVLKAFLGSKMDAADRWGMTLPCALGDDRLVPLLSKQIPIWAESQRVKMAEYAALALALLGTDTALSVISRLILKYSTKRKNIGTASEEAFSAVARARGLTLDELGDRVVPWLGFESGKPRIVEAGGKNFEVRISNEFKIVFFDLEKKKPVASLPKTASKELADEIKQLKDSLKEVLKGQTPRIENLMVLQYRWPAEVWRELYPTHPILRIYSSQLVWGKYDATGNRTKTFRLLDDGTLTDFDDNAVTINIQSGVGVVHPLEWDAETLDRWRAHFADYEIVQPFPQLHRRVVTPNDGEKPLRFAKNWYDSQIHGQTFNSRAEKLGWSRDPYCEGGFIEFFAKHFRQSKVIGVVAVRNMPVYGMDETITVRDVYFAKVEKKGEYGDYPIPCDGRVDENDDRILSFENVPPIAFSEIMADMEKIVGLKTEAD